MNARKGIDGIKGWEAQNPQLFLIYTKYPYGLARMPLISLRSPINISLMVKVAKRKPLCNEGKHTSVENVILFLVGP